MIYIETDMKEMPSKCGECAVCVKSMFTESAACRYEGKNVKRDSKPLWCPLKSINDLITKIQSLKLSDDSSGLKQNAVIDKVLEIIKSSFEQRR
jgi:hypothetical protein